VWFTDPVKIQGFRNFLGNLTLPNVAVHTLVIAGDLIEMWQNPFEENQAPAQTILQSPTQLGSPVREFIDLLKRVQQNNITLVVMPGNHDAELLQSDLINAGLTNVVWRDDAYMVNNLRIEHGHLYDLYNAPDPAGIRPFGYYVSRAVSTSKRAGSIDSVGVFVCQLILSQSTVVSAVRYNALPLLQKVVDNALGGSLVSSSYTMFNRYKYASVKQGCFYSAQTEDDVLLGLAVYKYRSLYDRWIKQHDIEYVQNMVKGGCNEFDYFIARMQQDLVIFGHTHKALVKKVNRANGSFATYINSGSITINQVPKLTYVIIDQTPGTKITTRARLMEYEPTTGKSLVLEDTPIGNSGSKTPVAPPGWTCSPFYYNVTDGCDCDCGLVDPDCLSPNAKIYNCATAPNLNSWCSDQGTCEYEAIKPAEYTCPLFFNVDKGCQCECGSYDPACAFTNITNCKDPTAVGCDASGACVLSGSQSKPPASWLCPAEWYGTSDGCDCNCGAVDPDCSSSSSKIANGCSCRGIVPNTFVPNFEVGFWIVLGLGIGGFVLSSIAIAILLGLVIFLGVKLKSLTG